MMYSFEYSLSGKSHQSTKEEMVLLEQTFPLGRKEWIFFMELTTCTMAILLEMAQSCV